MVRGPRMYNLEFIVRFRVGLAVGLAVGFAVGVDVWLAVGLTVGANKQPATSVPQRVGTAQGSCDRESVRDATLEVTGTEVIEAG